MKHLICWLFHRPHHRVLLSSGLPFPLDFDDVWFCQRCDTAPGLPALVGSPA